MRPLLLRLHFYAGIFIAPFLMLAAATGGLYAMSWQLEAAIYSDVLTVDSVGEEPLLLSQQTEIAQSAFPEGVVDAVRVGDEAHDATWVLFDYPESEESQRHAVFVDPYSGEIRGELAAYGDSAALPVRAWISQLHKDLHLGDAGRLYSELAASWLWVIALGGAALWLTRLRSRRRPSAVRRSAAAVRRKTMARHGALGLTLLVALLFLSATGLTWSKHAGANVADMRAEFGWTAPVVAGGESHDHSSHDEPAHAVHPDPPGADVSGFDLAAHVAAEHGYTAPLQIQPSATLDDVYLISAHGDELAVDVRSATVIDELRFADHPLMAKLATWGVQGHMGSLFGLANQLLLAATAVGVTVLTAWGYRMWWLRRPGRREFGRAYPRGHWRSVPLTILFPAAALVVVIGVFLPLLGLSLLGFLAADAVIGARARRLASRGNVAADPGPEIG